MNRRGREIRFVSSEHGGVEQKLLPRTVPRAEGHNACIKPLAGRLIEMQGSFDRGAAIARIQSVIEKTRGSVGPFLFSFRLGREVVR